MNFLKHTEFLEIHTMLLGKARGEFLSNPLRFTAKEVYLWYNDAEEFK